MTVITKSVLSNDGTTIGYRQIGKGRGLIICHGAGRISQNYQKLATAFADDYTVFIPDRRGRGLSGQAGENYNIHKACEDLAAVIQATGAELIFGHSAGGLIALETVISQPIKKLALYEPPLSINGSIPSSWLPEFENTLDKGKRKQAMAIFLKGVRSFEAVDSMPSWALLLLVNLLGLLEMKKEPGTRMLDLLPTIPQDVKIARQLDSTFRRYQDIAIPTLLLTGSNSQPYYHQAIKALENTLPHSTTKMYDGFDHFSPEEKVEDIAKTVKRFFETDEMAR